MGGLDRLNRAESPLQGKIPRDGSQAQTQATVQASRKPSRSSVRSIPSEGVHHVSRTASSMASIEEETVDQLVNPQGPVEPQRCLRDWLDHPDNVKSINCSAGHESGGTSTWWTANDSPRMALDDSSALPGENPARVNENHTFLDSVMRTFACCGRGVILPEGSGGHGGEAVAASNSAQLQPINR